MSTVKITKGDFSQKVEEGWKRDQLAEHYGITSSDVTKILKQLGLRIRKFHIPRFELVDDEEGVLVEHQVTKQDVDNNPNSNLVEGEKVSIPVKETPEPQAKEETEVAEVQAPVKRKRRTKAEIEAEKFAETLKAEETAPVVEEDQPEVAEVTTETAIAWGAAPFEGGQVVENDSPVTEETATEVPTEDIIDVSKATENIETSFNIPSGATQGTEDEHVNASPISNPTPTGENPFTKAWGSQG